MLLNKEQVKDYLPHRSPFLFVDSIEEVIIPEHIQGQNNLSPKDIIGTKVVAHFYVDPKLEILKGHFPGNPILPGVVQVEMMAQSAAFVSLALTNLDYKDLKVETLLISVDSCKFRKPILPGMNLIIKSEIVSVRGSIAKYEACVFLEGEKISETTFMAKLILNKGNK